MSGVESRLGEEGLHMGEDGGEREAQLEMLDLKGGRKGIHAGSDNGRNWRLFIYRRTDQ